MNVLNKITIEPYGFSHSQVIGFKLGGVSAGVHIDFQQIDQLLLKRKGNQSLNTTRSESEQLVIISGILNKITTGDVIEIQIEQSQFRKSDYQFGLVRPGHADLSAYLKYKNNYQYSGGGQFSGRLTVLYVIAGEIARQALNIDLQINGHVAQVGPFSDKRPTARELQQISEHAFPFYDKQLKPKVLEYIANLKKQGDSVGGKLRIVISNVNDNYGDDFFASLESKISFLLFTIPAVKAVEFGLGSEFANKRGREVIERLVASEGKVTSATNYNGGIVGGIATSINDIEILITIKPTSSLFGAIQTVKYQDDQFKPAILNLKGRHDAFIANRALWPAVGLLYILFLDLEESNVKTI